MIDMNTIVALAFVAMVGITIGVLIGRSGRRKLLKQAKQLSLELNRSVVHNREQNRKTSRMHEEQSSVANFVMQLPYTVQELNREDLDPREVPKLILETARAFFDPDQILLYLANPVQIAGEESGPFHLAATHGLTEVPNGASQITNGLGKIGWVAEHQVEMTRDDWHNRTLFDGPPPVDNAPGLILDLIGPMVRHGTSGNTTLGVLCLGRPAGRTRDVKLMLQMVTNLASISVIHSQNLSRLRTQANHDGLTGLLNKRHFMSEIGTMIFDSEQNAKPIGLFIFDIDQFKQYNDTNGHPAGDELLKGLADILRASLRPGDIACRYGGEEFVVAMPNTNGTEALLAAERIRDAIEKKKFAHEASQPSGKLTSSGGVAAFPFDGTNGTELLSHADRALYLAKASGRNKVLRHQGVNIGTAQDDGPDDPILPGDAFKRNIAGER